MTTEYRDILARQILVSDSDKISRDAEHLTPEQLVGLLRNQHIHYIEFCEVRHRIKAARQSGNDKQASALYPRFRQLLEQLPQKIIEEELLA